MQIQQERSEQRRGPGSSGSIPAEERALLCRLVSEIERDQKCEVEATQAILRQGRNLDEIRPRAAALS